jgi:hypothetical protein
VLVRRREPIWIQAGIIFIHVPKAAGTAINDALYGRFMGHVHACDIERWGSKRLKSLPTFAVTRNPWDRLVSAYRFVRRGGGIGGPHAGRVRRAEQYVKPEFETFERFVNEWLAGRDLSKLDIAFRPQWPFVCDQTGNVIVDHLGRFEELDPTWAYLRKKLPALPPVQQTNRSGAAVDYRRFYNPEVVDLVASIYARDIAFLGYAFE